MQFSIETFWYLAGLLGILLIARSMIANHANYLRRKDWQRRKEFEALLCRASREGAVISAMEVALVPKPATLIWNVENSASASETSWPAYFSGNAEIHGFFMTLFAWLKANEIKMISLQLPQTGWPVFAVVWPKDGGSTKSLRIDKTVKEGWTVNVEDLDGDLRQALSAFRAMKQG